MAADLENPVINSPYEPPSQHFELASDGPTGVLLEGRRKSESFVPIAGSRKGKEQPVLDFDLTGERREENSLINDVRFQVDLWRARGYPGATPTSKKLLNYWSEDPERGDPVFFCQREAVETAIYLTEAAGRQGNFDFRNRIDQENRTHNNGLPRVGIKMATGSGKTVVMAMLIAWQTLNKAANTHDSKYTSKFLIVAPGITIKDRLRVLQPSDPNNYYRERDLIPGDMWQQLLQAQIVITNYHAFMLKDTKEISGVASNTRKILTYGKKTDPFKETPDQMVSRVLRDLVNRGGKSSEIMVLNDEAHHCYQDRPLDEGDVAKTDDKNEIEQRNADARIWFKGLEAVNKKVGIKTIYDLSATPFYLRGSGYNEGYIFPWVVSDFSLMDAIESGIVKVPRVPVDDDAPDDGLIYKQLWDYIGAGLPKKKGRNSGDSSTWVIPNELQGALESLYRSYERRYEHWEKELAPLGETPPVLIVVCNNTLVSKLVCDWIAGFDVEQDDGTFHARSGKLKLLSNVEDGAWVKRPRTILIDSAQLESGESMGRDFKQAAGHEIQTFKDEYRRRNPGADVEKLTDEDLLREVMNTVGKKGRLGEHVRCVVSVSMLTEGWDANTVTHILGIRKFGSQLLCEQVVGRGLRRRSYALNENGLFDPEYAEVYGVPFAFIPGKPTKEAPPRPPAVEVKSVPERYDLRITFPKVDGYRLEIPDEDFYTDFDKSSQFHLDNRTIATLTETSGVIGSTEFQDLDKITNAREQQIAFQLAEVLLTRVFPAHDQVPRPWLYPKLVEISRQWIRECVMTDGTTPLGVLLLAENLNLAAETIRSAILKAEGARTPRILPILRPFDSEGTTDEVDFFTRKIVVPTEKSPIDKVVLDGPGGNSWEQIVATICEKLAVGENPLVHSYVKNDHLGFSIPYVFEGRSYHYYPDFLIRLTQRPDDEIRTLIVEVSGGQKSVHSPGSTKAKAETAQTHWCASVNNRGGLGRWGFIEISNIAVADAAIANGIESLYNEGEVTGLHNQELLGV